MVANNVHAAPFGSQQQQQQQQVALQHVRLLASLCNCPIYMPSPTRHAQNATSQLAPSAVRELKQNGLEQASAAALRQDEAQANLLMFECLKSSPVEMITQQIPFGLIDMSHEAMQSNVETDGTARFVIDRRWHRPLYELAKSVLESIGDDKWIVPASLKSTWSELFNQIFAAKAQMFDDNYKHNDELVATSVIPSGISGSFARVTADQLDKLIACLVATKQFIKDFETTDKEEGQQQRQQELTSRRAELVSDLLDDLLGAIYLPSNETLVSPIFAPHLDPGTILLHNSLSLADSMLQKESPFGRHDLLIGSSVPLVNLDPHATSGRLRRQAPSYETSDTTTSGNDAPMLEHEINALVSQYYSIAAASSSSLPFSDELLYPLERFDKRHLDRVGLTEEQSIQQISLFVRTYYRYHQQEIINSIINHYYLNFDQQSSAAGAGNGNSRPNTNQNSSQGDHQAAASGRTAQNAKRLHLLQALISAYRDSLISVPLVKTALIHSIKQLDALVDPFIGQHLLKLSETIESSGNSVLDMNSSRREALGAVAIDEFKSFVSQLCDSSQGIIWPIKLLRKPHALSSVRQQADIGVGADLDGVHSTYLYQFGANLDSWLIGRLTRTISATKQKQSANSGASSEGSQNDDLFAVRQKVLFKIGQNLANNVLAKLLSNDTMGRFKLQLGIGCGVVASTFSKIDDPLDDSGYDDGGDESWPGLDVGLDFDGELLGQFRDWICQELGRKIVAPFVRSGNVNAALSFGALNSDSEQLDEQLDQFGVDCARVLQSKPGTELGGQDQNDDHHAFLLNSSNSTPPQTDEADKTTSSTIHLDDKQKDKQLQMTDDDESALCRKRLNWLTMRYFIANQRELSSPSRLERHSNGSSPVDQSNNWPVFNVFDQHIATLLEQRTSQSESHAALWLGDSFAKSSGSESTSRVSINGGGVSRQTLGTTDERLSRDNFDRKLAFWANFIPTLNCSRTQPISPNSLLYSTLASNLTLLNMNLDFNCNHQQTMTGSSLITGTTQAPLATVSSMVETIRARIRRATLDHINKLAKRQESRRRQMTAASGTSQMNIQQSHHSLRMASAASMTTDMANGSLQQQQQLDDLSSGPDENATEQADQQHLQQSNGGSNNWPILSNSKQQDSALSSNNAANKSSWPSFVPLFDKITGTSANRRTLIGLWIIASTILLVGTTLLTSGCIIITRRKRRQRQQQQTQAKVIEPTQSIQLDQEQEGGSRFRPGATEAPLEDERVDHSSGNVLRLDRQATIETEHEAKHLQANASNNDPASDRSSSTLSRSTARNQQQQQQLLHDHYQHHHQDQQHQLVQESLGSELDDSNEQGIGDNNCAMVVLNGYHQLSPGFIDYNLLAQQQQQYAGDQENDDYENDESQQQRQQEIILPIISAPRYLTAQQQQSGQQQQQHVSGGANSIMGSCHHLADCNFVLLQSSNANCDSGGEFILNDQQQVLSSGSETTTTTNRANSSVSLVSSSTTTTLTNSNINNNNNSNSHDSGSCLNGSSNWRQQQQTKKRVKISDPMNCRKNGNSGVACHIDEGAHSTSARRAKTMTTSHEDCSDSGQLYLNGGNYMLTPLGQVNGTTSQHHRSDQIATTTAGTNTYCHIHQAHGSEYLLSETPTSSGSLLNGSQTVDLNCGQSTRFGQQFVHAGSNHDHRYLGSVASGHHDSELNESPIATVGSLSDYLNINASNLDLRTMNFVNINGSLCQLATSNDHLTAQAMVGSHRNQINSQSLGGRAANRRRQNKLKDTIRGSRSSPQ